MTKLEQKLNHNFKTRWFFRKLAANDLFNLLNTLTQKCEKLSLYTQKSDVICDNAKNCEKFMQLNVNLNPGL